MKRSYDEDEEYEYEDDPPAKRAKPKKGLMGLICFCLVLVFLLGVFFGIRSWATSMMDSYPLYIVKQAGGFITNGYDLGGSRSDYVTVKTENTGIEGCVKYASISNSEYEKGVYGQPLATAYYLKFDTSDNARKYYESKMGDTTRDIYLLKNYCLDYPVYKELSDGKDHTQEEYAINRACNRMNMRKSIPLPVLIYAMFVAFDVSVLVY